MQFSEETKKGWSAFVAGLKLYLGFHACSKYFNTYTLVLPYMHKLKQMWNKRVTPEPNTNIFIEISNCCSSCKMKTNKQYRHMDWF